MSKPGLTPSKTLMQLQFMKKAAQKETMEKAKIEEEADSHWKLQDVSKGARVISLKGERSSNGHRSFGGFNSALEKQSFEPPKEIFKKQRGVSISDEEMALIYKPTKKTREDFQSPPPEEPKKSSRSSGHRRDSFLHPHTSQPKSSSQKSSEIKTQNQKYTPQRDLHLHEREKDKQQNKANEFIHRNQQIEHHLSEDKNKGTDNSMKRKKIYNDSFHSSFSKVVDKQPMHKQ